MSIFQDIRSDFGEYSRHSHSRREIVGHHLRHWIWVRLQVPVLHFWINSAVWRWILTLARAWQHRSFWFLGTIPGTREISTYTASSMISKGALELWVEWNSKGFPRRAGGRLTGHPEREILVFVHQNGVTTQFTIVNYKTAKAGLRGIGLPNFAPGLDRGHSTGPKK